MIQIKEEGKEGENEGRSEGRKEKALDKFHQGPQGQTDDELAVLGMLYHCIRGEMVRRVM